MPEPTTPFVSVLTPVYNGERYLAECIESVLSQRHERFEYVIVDNASTDRTPEIAARYAARDPRVRVIHNDKLLPIIRNWNHAMRQMSPESAYCKVVHADDCLFPECIERMVELAEEHPDVGVVGSYRLDGRIPRPSPGLAYTSPVARGIDVCRDSLRREHSLFGSPSSLLLRSSLVRDRDSFYDERYLHADKAVCLHLLQKWDFGFVPQLLSYTRIHDESESATTADRLGTRVLENFLMLLEFGPACLPEAELRERAALEERRYYRALARRIPRRGGLEVYRHHAGRLRAHGQTLSAAGLARGVVAASLDRLLDPRGTWRSLRGSRAR